MQIEREHELIGFFPSHRIRQACHWVVNLRYFDDFILVIILISSVLLAVEDPVNPDSSRNEVSADYQYLVLIFLFPRLVLKR